MNDEEFKLLDSIEEGQWWFVGKRLILDSLLRRHAPSGRLLDLGCGTGGILREWAERVPCFGTDRSELAVRICHRKGFRQLARSDLSAIPFADGSFDTVLALDVIEHLDDDIAFLERASRLCAPGGRVIIAVPAFQSLWSQHDETFEHRRRYNARELEAVMRRAGLEPERTTYTNALVFPVAALWRVLSYRLGLGRFSPKHDFWEIPAWLNRALVRAYHLESRWLESRDLPVGVSVVCIARRAP